jgi:hypothetical protein
MRFKLFFIILIFVTGCSDYNGSKKNVDSYENQDFPAGTQPYYFNIKPDITVLSDEIKFDREFYNFYLRFPKNYKDYNQNGLDSYIKIPYNFYYNILKTIEFENNYIIITELNNFKQNFIENYVNKLKNKNDFSGAVFKSNWLLVNNKFVVYQLIVKTETDKKVWIKLILAPVLNDYLMIDFVLNEKYYNNNLELIENVMGSMKIKFYN